MQYKRFMQTLKKLLISGVTAVVTLPVLVSCGLIEINGTGYTSLGPVEKAHVKKCTEPIDSLKDDGNVYQVTASQVKEYMQKHDYVIIYRWFSFCQSEECVNPAYAKKVCEERGYTFCLVAGDYDHMDRAFGLGFPVLAIDRDAYGSDNYKKLAKKFYGELLGNRYDKTKGEDLFYKFHKGQYVESFPGIKDVK